MILASTKATMTGIAFAVLLAVLTDLVTGWLRSLLRQVGRGLTTRLRFHRDPTHDDHSTIHSGWIRVESGHWSQVHVHVRCAPSRRWDQPRRMHRDGVYRFVHRVRPGLFPHEADYSVPDELIRFVTPDQSTNPPNTAFACVFPTGVIEVAVPIAHRATPEGPVLAANSVSDLIAAFQREVASGAYQRIFGVTPGRIDWFLNVSPALADDAHQYREWVDIEFPGRRPGGRALGMRPSADPRGYGRNAARSIPTNSATENVLRPLLTDFLERNGFHDLDGSVEDIIAMSLTAIDKSAAR